MQKPTRLKQVFTSVNIFLYLQERIFSHMKRLMIKMIRFYQKYISVQSAPSCRFIPTCSHYAIEAIETHGAIKGGYLAAKRILRCHPWGKMGYDPVPSKCCKHHKDTPHSQK